MKKNLVLLILCALGLTTMAQNPLVGVDHSVFADDASLVDVWGYGVPTAYPAGHTTYRVYGYLDDANSVMQAVIGVPGGLEAYIGTDEPDGYLWNYPALGVEKAFAIPSGFIPFFGDNGTVMYDSYVTIGSENDAIPAGGNDITFGVGVSNVPAATYWGAADYADIANPDFIMTNEAWLLGDVTGANAFGVGPSFQVLLAQLTTTAADIHYGLNITALTDVPLSGGETWITYWDPSGLGGTTFNEDGGGDVLGLVYPAPPPGCIGTEVNVSVGGGTFDSEISWELYDGSGVLVASGGAPDFQGPFCIEDGCAEMVMFDSFGDGWNGAIYDITLVSDGTSVFSGTTAGLGGTDFLDFGATGTCPVFGCLDTTACNFDSTANTDDGSCEFTSCAGCTASAAINFDSTATIDDGTCIIADCNPDPPINFSYCYTNGENGEVFLFESSNPGVNNVSLIFLAGTIESSTFDLITIYDGVDNTAPVLYTNAGSGTIELDGVAVESTGDFIYIELISDGSVSCDTSLGYNPWSIDVYCGDVSAVVPGCIDTTACNFDSLATADDGSCCFDNCVTLNVGGGTFDSEMSWDLYDAGGILVASGGAGSFELCLTDGCHQFDMFDSFGDGWNGGTYDFVGIATGDMDSADLGDGSGFGGENDDFGTDFIDVGATGTCPVFGCLDTTACNYDSLADTDDGSCTFPGCTDSFACNYDSTAGCDDGSCIEAGCTDPLACNYDSTAGCDDGTCSSDNDAPDCSTVAVPVSDVGSCVSIPVDLTAATDNLFSVNSGAERWYSFVATSSVVHITLTNVNAPAQDALLGLYDSGFGFITGGDYTTGNFDDEALVFEGLTTGDTYYVAVEEWNANPSTMTADLCIVQYADSGCDLPPSLAAGPFTIQSQLKADYNAAAVGYRLTMTSTTSGLSYTSPDQTGTWIYIVYSGAPNVPDNYNATLEACYEVVLPGFGGTINVYAGTSCNVDVGQFDTYLVAAHTCANKTWSLTGRPKAAPPQVDAGSFTWEFTQTAPVPGAAWEYTTPTGARKLPAGGLGAIVGDDAVSVIDAGATYDVRIRANYNSGSATDFGPTECLQVAGASGGTAANGPSDTDGTFAEAAKSLEDLYGETLTIYPNPSNGDFFNLSISEVNDNKVLVNIVDLQGRTIQSVQLSADIDAPFNQQISLDNLSSGNYMVNVTVGSSMTSTQLVVVR